MFEPEEDELDGPVGAAAALASPNGASLDQMPDVETGGPQKAQTGSPDDQAAVDLAGGEKQEGGLGEDYSQPVTSVDDSESFVDGAFGDAGDPGESGSTQGGYTAPTLPTAPHYESTSDLEAKKAHDMELNLANYKPSVGRRIAAGFAAGMAGFGHMGNAAELGANVLDAPKNRALEQQKQTLASDQAQIDAVNNRNKVARQGYSDQVGQYGMEERNMRNQAYAANQNAQAESRRSLAQSRMDAPATFNPKDPNNPWAGGVITTRGGKQLPDSAPPTDWLKAWSASPQGKLALQSMTIQQRQQAAQQMKLTPQEAKYFIANGKLAEPTAHTNINIRENPDGSAVQPGAGRGPQNVDDQISAITADATRAKQSFADMYDRDPQTGRYKLSPDATPSQNMPMEMSPQEFRDKMDRIGRTAPNVKLAKMGAYMDEQGNLQRGNPPKIAQSPEQQQSTQQQAPQQQQQAAPQPPRQSAKGMPDQTVARNPKTGKVEWTVKGGTWVRAQ